MMPEGFRSDVIARLWMVTLSVETMDEIRAKLLVELSWCCDRQTEPPFASRTSISWGTVADCVTQAMAPVTESTLGKVACGNKWFIFSGGVPSWTRKRML